MESVEGTLEKLVGDSEWIQGYKEGLKACAELDKEKNDRILFLERENRELWFENGEMSRRAHKAEKELKEYLEKCGHEIGWAVRFYKEKLENGKVKYIIPEIKFVVGGTKDECGDSEEI